MNKIKEIYLNEIENIKIGHAQDIDAATGCTVIICEKGAPTGVDIRGGGPASRESELLNPRAASEAIHAVLLSGGSAFGLDAAGGVMQYLEERNIGFDVGITKVPLVCESCIFDLGIGNMSVRPNQSMGYSACENAELNLLQEGNIGAGIGATVGKFHVGKGMMKAGLGTYAVQIGELKVGALVVVNALGDIIDPTSGKIIAGLLNDDETQFINSEEAFYHAYSDSKNLFTGNTTIGAIITNAKFTKSQMGKIAAMAQNGYARTICPVHTTADGDSIYAMSVGNIQADINVVGTLASRVMEKAILKAAYTTPPAYGLKSAQSFL